jgi:Zn-dependent peptidase ImmA (M78 family)
MKQLSLKRIREVFPRFNRSPVTEEDFWRTCKRLGIIVKSMPLMVDGYHERKRGRYYIIVNNRLDGDRWLHTALHEFCHYLFDAPTHNKNYVFYRGKDGEIDERERFADAFALVAMLPWPEVERLSREEYVADNPTLLNLCMDRIAVRKDYRM